MQNTGASRSFLLLPALILLLIAALLLLGACSSGAPSTDKPAAAGSSEDNEPAAIEGQTAEEVETPQMALSGQLSAVDPCTLLTAAEVEAAFGEPVGSVERETIYTYESCNFHNQGGGKFIILQLTQQSPELFKRDNEETAAMFEVELVQIDGMGDEAVYYSGLLRVRLGDSVFQLATWHPEAEQDQALELMQSLAQLILERYP